MIDASPADARQLFRYDYAFMPYVDDYHADIAAAIRHCRYDAAFISLLMLMPLFTLFRQRFADDVFAAAFRYAAAFIR